MTLERSIVELETHNRIKVLLWAYAYEMVNKPLVDDATFDKVCASIDLSINTTNKEMDEWFLKHFVPYTGQWIHSLPNKELIKLNYLLNRYGAGYENRN